MTNDGVKLGPKKVKVGLELGMSEFESKIVENGLVGVKGELESKMVEILSKS